MAEDTVKCPHCFGDKPAAAKVCLHCGRDEQGFGPMVRTSQAVVVSSEGTLYGVLIFLLIPDRELNAL